MRKQILLAMVALMTLFLFSTSAQAVVNGPVNLSINVCASSVGAQAVTNNTALNVTKGNITCTVKTSINSTGITAFYSTDVVTWTKFYENDTDNVPEGGTSWRFVFDPINWTSTNATYYFNVTANNTPTLAGIISFNYSKFSVEIDGLAPTVSTSGIETSIRDEYVEVAISVNDGSSTCRYDTTDAAYPTLANTFNQQPASNVNYTRAFLRSFETGDTTIYIRCTDDHHNFMGASSSITISRSTSGSIAASYLATGGELPTSSGNTGLGVPQVGVQQKLDTNMIILVVVVVLVGLGAWAFFGKGKKGRKRRR